MAVFGMPVDAHFAGRTFANPKDMDWESLRMATVQELYVAAASVASAQKSPKFGDKENIRLASDRLMELFERVAGLLEDPRMHPGVAIAVAQRRAEIENVALTQLLPIHRDKSPSEIAAFVRELSQEMTSPK